MIIIAIIIIIIIIYVLLQAGVWMAVILWMIQAALSGLDFVRFKERRIIRSLKNAENTDDNRAENEFT